MVCVTCDSGTYGVGEVATSTACASYSQDAVLVWLSTYSAVLTGLPISSINALHRRLDAAGGHADWAAHAARAAIDMAAFDLIGKLRGCPVHELLGGGYHQEFELFLEIDASAQKQGAEASSPVNHGYAGVKLAIADSHRLQSGDESDAKSIELVIKDVLSAAGSGTYVDLVAHQSLGNVARATMLIEAVLHDQFHSNLALQQPLHWLDLKGHAQLREKLTIPVTLDASITSPEATMQVVRLAAADRIVLDIWQVGGLRSAMRIANICEAAAIGVTVQGNCCTSVGLAAMSHLAAAIHDRYPINIIGDYHSDQTLITGGPVVRNGRVLPSNGVGLGVELNDIQLA